MSTKLARVFCPKGPCRQLYRYSDPDQALEVELPIMTDKTGLLKKVGQDEEKHAETAAERQAILPHAQLFFYNTLFELFSLDFFWDRFNDLLESLREELQSTDEFQKLVQAKKLRLDADVPSFSMTELYAAIQAVHSLTESTCINQQQSELLNQVIGFLNAMFYRHDEAFELDLSKLFVGLARGYKQGQLQPENYSKIPANERALHYLIYIVSWSILNRNAPKADLSGDPKLQEQEETEHQDWVGDRIDTIISEMLANFLENPMMVDLKPLLHPEFDEEEDDEQPEEQTTKTAHEPQESGTEHKDEDVEEENEDTQQDHN